MALGIAIHPTRRRNVRVIYKGILHAELGSPLVVADAPVRIGRSPLCQVVLDDAEVSALHCEVYATAEGVQIRDLGSKNGTFVNGVRIREGWLTSSCTIGIGRLSVRFDPVGRELAELHPEDRFGPLVGASSAMKRVFSKLSLVAPTDVSVLITGETGTGKELVARAIHGASHRADEPLVIIDCSTIPPTLAESELFGHERGSFTGADQQTSGAFRKAHRGTLFLDEIGELPLPVQAKLLRALAEREVKRVGCLHYEKIDVRFLAATNRDLARRVNECGFRDDLFFRIAQVSIELPPLRERRQDIPAIARAVCDKVGKSERAGEVIALLENEFAQRQWPGNVRELVNLVETVVSLPSGADYLRLVLRDVDDMREGAAPELAYGRAKCATIKAFEWEYFMRLVRETQYNVSEMARRSGLGRDKVRAHLRRLGIAKES